MNASTSSDYFHQSHEQISPGLALKAGSVAAISVGIIMWFNATLPKEGEQIPRSPKEPQGSHSKQDEDRKLQKRRKPLEEGDAGLEIHRGQEIIEFRYTFTLHPLRELPNDQQYALQFATFIRGWIRAQGFDEEDWCILPVRVHRESTPDERWPVPNTLCEYRLESMAMPKAALRPHNGLVAER